MKPRRILLARHGESLGNVDKSEYAKTPDDALPLTSLGAEQARKLGRDIKDRLPWAA